MHLGNMHLGLFSMSNQRVFDFVPFNIPLMRPPFVLTRPPFHRQSKLTKSVSQFFNDKRLYRNKITQKLKGKLYCLEIQLYIKLKSDSKTKQYISILY